MKSTIHEIRRSAGGVTTKKAKVLHNYFLFVDDDHPQVVYVSAEDVAADVIQEGLGIFTKKADLKVNKKPVWKHITRDMFLFYSGKRD